MNAIVQAAPPITPEEFLKLTDLGSYELVDGRLVEVNVSVLSNWVAGEILRRIGNQAKENGLGWVFPGETYYRCFPWKPNQIRRPDASFLRAERVRPEDWPEGFVTVAPDLAVEVVSPNDLVVELDRKVGEYLRAGVRLVWVVFPETRGAMVHRADGTVSKVDENGDLDGENVVPGFRVRVGDLFPPGAPAPAEPEGADGA